MDLGIKGRTAFICGGSAGIGFAIAEEFVREGVHLFLVGRDYDRLEKAVKKLKRIDPTLKIEGKQLDLLDAKSIEKVVTTLLKKNSIDILIHNVGGPMAGNPTDLTLENWDRGYESLLRSAILLNQLIIPGMRKRKWGRILGITSTAAIEMIPKLPISATFRSGLSAYVKLLAKEVGREGVLVNNLLPGPTNTERLKELKTKSPAFFNSMGEETAIGRIAEPEEIAKAAVFFCSNASSFITGTDLLVDGGYTRGY